MTKEAFLEALVFEPFVYEEVPSVASPSGYSGVSYPRPTNETRMRVREGAVLKLKSGEIYLVGYCNEILGVCDDCRDFDYQAIAEIAYLWDAT